MTVHSIPQLLKCKCITTMKVTKKIVNNKTFKVTLLVLSENDKKF